jgi:hypothetical protein
MDGRGRALDHVLVERLWRTVKYEEGYLTCIPHIVVRVCVATFVKTYHLATLAL